MNTENTAHLTAARLLPSESLGSFGLAGGAAIVVESIGNVQAARAAVIEQLPRWMPRDLGAGSWVGPV